MANWEQRLKPGMAFITAAAFLVTGCGTREADVAACEAFVKGDGAPSGYSLVSVERTDGPPVSGRDFPKVAGMVRPRDGDPRQRTWDLAQSIYGDAKQTLRQLLLTYTIEEAGTRRQQQAVCAFRLVNGKLADHDILISRAAWASRIDPIDTLDTLEGRPRHKRPRYACCLDP